jgi:hypothetical protein
MCVSIHLSSLSLAGSLLSLSLSLQSDRDNAKGRALLHGFGFGNRKYTSLRSLSLSLSSLYLSRLAGACRSADILNIYLSPISIFEGIHAHLIHIYLYYCY